MLGKKRIFKSGNGVTGLVRVLILHSVLVKGLLIGVLVSIHSQEAQW
jgi:hypothetical protein